MIHAVVNETNLVFSLDGVNSRKGEILTFALRCPSAVSGIILACFVFLCVCVLEKCILGMKISIEFGVLCKVEQFVGPILS